MARSRAGPGWPRAVGVAAMVLLLAGLATAARDVAVGAPMGAEAPATAAVARGESASAIASEPPAPSPPPSSPPLLPLRPEPIQVADDLGAIDPSTWLAGAPVPQVLPILHDRRFVTPPSPWLPDPSTAAFTSSIDEVPDDVLARSTWRPDCPVTRDELRWVRVSHVGFDGRAHGGELLVHRDAAEGMVAVFRRLYEARYPIERMRIAGPVADVRAWWTHDDNSTGAFVCRQAVSGGRWSQHAYGLAVDVNPFHNPYVKGEVLIPPHAAAYLVRDHRPGIVHGGDEVTTAFTEELGWFWGGYWSSALDYMHFSWNDW